MEKKFTRIKYRSKSDSLGRCSFTLFWMADYHPGDPAGENRIAERAQCFFADPREYGFPRPEEQGAGYENNNQS